VTHLNEKSGDIECQECKDREGLDMLGLGEPNCYDKDGFIPVEERLPIGGFVLKDSPYSSQQQYKRKRKDTKGE